MENIKLNIGDRAPNFKLQASNETNVSLEDFTGKQIVLYFYPRDNTPGCTKEACYFRDNFETIEQKKAVILGISMDSIESHSKFIEKQNLNFLLLSDKTGDICKKYGVYKLKNMYGKKHWGIERSTFIIDKKGNIAKIFAKVKVEGHIQEVLDSLMG